MRLRSEQMDALCIAGKGFNGELRAGAPRAHFRRSSGCSDTGAPVAWPGVTTVRTRVTLQVTRALRVLPAFGAAAHRRLKLGSLVIDALELTRYCGHSAQHGGIFIPMTNVDRILAEAMKLSDEERAALADRLLEIVPEVPDTDVEEAWMKEALRRRAEWKAGRAKAIPLTEALTQMFAKS